MTASRLRQMGGSITLEETATPADSVWDEADHIQASEQRERVDEPRAAVERIERLTGRSSVGRGHSASAGMRQPIGQARLRPSSRWPCVPAGEDRERRRRLPHFRWPVPCGLGSSLSRTRTVRDAHEPRRLVQKRMLAMSRGGRMAPDASRRCVVCRVAGAGWRLVRDRPRRGRDDCRRLPSARRSPTSRAGGGARVWAPIRAGPASPASCGKVASPRRRQSDATHWCPVTPRGDLLVSD